MKPPSENYKIGGHEVFCRFIIRELYEACVVENMMNEFIPAVSNVGGNAYQRCTDEPLFGIEKTKKLSMNEVYEEEGDKRGHDFESTVGNSADSL